MAADMIANGRGFRTWPPPGAAGRRPAGTAAHSSPRRFHHDEEAIEDVRRLAPVVRCWSWPCVMTGMPAGAQQPRMGGELIFPVPSEPPSYDGHREETFGLIHPLAPFYSTLLRVDPDRPHRDQARRRPGRELDRLQGRPHLHVQAPPGRQVPRRGRDDVDGRQGVLRQDRLPAGRRRVEPEGPVPLGGGGRGAGPLHRALPAEVAGELVHARAVVALQLHLQGRDPREGHPLVREEHHGDRPLQVRRAREGLPRRGQEEPRLLGQGQALPRRLPRRVRRPRRRRRSR